MSTEATVEQEALPLLTEVLDAAVAAAAERDREGLRLAMQRELDHAQWKSNRLREEVRKQLGVEVDAVLAGPYSAEVRFMYEDRPFALAIDQSGYHRLVIHQLCAGDSEECAGSVGLGKVNDRSDLGQFISESGRPKCCTSCDPNRGPTMGPPAPRPSAAERLADALVDVLQDRGLLPE